MTVRSVLVVALLSTVLPMEAAWAQSPAPSAPPSVSTAPPRPSAPAADVRQDIEAATQFSLDRDFGSALLRFSRAYDVAHDPKLLIDMATCEKNMQQYARAARYAEQALASATSGLTASQASEAHELYNTLLPFLGRVRVSVDPPGATVIVDEVTVGQAPLSAEVLVDTGERHFRVTKAGFRDFTATLTAAGGSQKLLDVKLDRDVEEGRVRIHTPPKNVVVLDGVIGYGNWDGRVAPGPHSLKISAPGMRPFEPDLLAAITDLRAQERCSKTQDNRRSPSDPVSLARLEVWLPDYRR